MDVQLTGDINLFLDREMVTQRPNEVPVYYDQAAGKLHAVLRLMKRTNAGILIALSLPLLYDTVTEHVLDIINAGAEWANALLNEFLSFFSRWQSIFYYGWLFLLFFGKRILGWYIRRRFGL